MATPAAPTPAPATAPVAPKPAVPAKPSSPAPPVPLPPRSGDHRDEGAVLRPALRAHSWTVKGFAKVTGGLDLDLLSNAGDLAVAGPALVDRCESVGHVTIEGPTTGTGPWTIAGEHRFGGPVTVQSLRAKGRVDVKGSLTATGPIEVDGTLEVRGDLQGGSVSWSGAATVDGTVRGSTIRVSVSGPSSVSALRGDHIQVSRRAGRLARDPPVLEVLEVEGKEVDLTGVVAQNVRGDRIRLGAGCRISRVDGTIVARDASAIVGPQHRTKLPKGLSR